MRQRKHHREWQAFADRVLLFRKRRAHKLRKILGTLAGCPWDTRRDKRGSTGRCPRDVLLVALERLTERTILPGHRPGVLAGTPGRPGGFRKFTSFFLCAFSAPWLSSLPKYRACAKKGKEEGASRYCPRIFPPKKSYQAENL